MVQPESDCHACATTIYRLNDYVWATEVTGGDTWLEGEVEVVKLPGDTIPNLPSETIIYAIRGLIERESITYSGPGNRSETNAGSEFDGLIIVVHDGETWRLVDVFDMTDAGSDA